MPLTKVGPNVPISSAYADEDLDPDRYQQLVRILDPDGKDSRPIVEVRHSLMCALSAQAWYALRVYVLLPPDKLHLRSRIRSHVLKHHADLPCRPNAQTPTHFSRISTKSALAFLATRTDHGAMRPRTVPVQLEAWIDCPGCGKFHKLSRAFQLDMDIAGAMQLMVRTRCEHCGSGQAFLYLERTVATIH
jgi:hypothetical protein